jgi:uncharacterized protein DUF6817
MINAKHMHFLIDNGAARIRHSGRLLLEHLAGTHDLLQQWGNPKHVYTAGLFHSIYGTNYFRHGLITDRIELQKQIGEEAEALVHIFAHADRPRAWFRYNIWPPQQLRELREIEAANLLEQGSTSRWLGELLTTDISAAAKAAITKHLNRDAAQQEAS